MTFYGYIPGGSDAFFDDEDDWSEDDEWFYFDDCIELYLFHFPNLIAHQRVSLPLLWCLQADGWIGVSDYDFNVSHPELIECTDLAPMSYSECEGPGTFGRGREVERTWTRRVRWPALGPGLW